MLAQFWLHGPHMLSSAARVWNCAGLGQQVVLLPIALGAFLKWALPRAMARFSPFAPLLASAMTVLVSASIVAQNAAAVRAAGPRLILAVVLLHTGAYFLIVACRVCSDTGVN